MMIEYYYAEVDSLTDQVVQCLIVEDAEVGPPRQVPSDHALQLLEAPIDWSVQPSPTSVLKWASGTLVWVETAPLSDVIARVRDHIDAAGEALRQATVNKRPLKGEEYTQAEAQARAWRAANYEGDAPRDVASWAAAKWRDEMTDREAADDILAQADQYRNLLSSIRARRLARMEDASHAKTVDEAQAARLAFDFDLSDLMKGI